MSRPMRASSLRSGPDTLIPIGVLMPVDSMSIRVLIGMVQALATPGMWIARSISAISSRVVLSGFGQASLGRSEEHTSELQSLMRISYAVFCLKKKNRQQQHNNHHA